MQSSRLPIVLVVDDEPMSLQALRRILEDEFSVLTADNVADAEKVLSEIPVQVVVSDQRMPDISGTDFLTQVRNQWPDVIRIIISAYTDPADLIKGINEAGIYNFIPKPWQPEHLILTLKNAVRLHRLQRENALLNVELKLTATQWDEKLKQSRDELKHRHHFDNITSAENSPMKAICAQVARIAPFDIPVLVTGESGTGKELITRAIHYSSHRADKPFVTENCGAMPVQLLESELFGHTRGAFTGATTERTGLLEQADGGTVFLDEIGDTSLEFQVKLLRFLQEGEIRPLGSNRSRHVNVRVIFATNRHLEDEVRAGRFREDLYYRLAAVPIHIPPLRERPMDISVIANWILQNHIIAYDKPVDGFTDEALECMSAYHWPGNVRELENEVRRMLVMTDSVQLGADLLSSKVLKVACGDVQQTNMPLLDEGSLKDRVEVLEARILKETLIRHKWNKSKAALELGLSRVGLRAKLERYGLEQNKLSNQ
ncbi:sigma-54-dependent transcriptional regulator [Enterovibrio nigricans]|uniref:DNA-binding transcriptional response regulator, NtrC family, contains REC, AAA-type ATPase, and a Fis-type DNA-binding domains n=1 Tax=Enterovibrio nigricans DSM 22720 TaxID=1121868 RepID=A0A1T4UYN7_9GAMM|nr:sigma-54 dependent transcriptional regulator [Enterovibrio nigricans]SKA57853.1 DNA-binding transcriptional response regulator, NtrC family, contains REC, AAA-type ATPase, and a Fis-type DNA-binding domains [Enterovibrio nigricans DSM 22720]